MKEELNKVPVRPRFSEDEYRAVVALENNESFKVFVESLKKRAVGLALLSTDLVGDNCLQTQGRSKELRDLSLAIDSARSDYEAIRKAEGKK